MKRLVIEQPFAFDEDNFTDVWLLGPPLSLCKILIHVDFNQPLTSRFDLMLTLMIPSTPIVTFNLPIDALQKSMLIGKKDQLLTEKCSTIQVEGNTSSSVSGKVSIYEISEEDRGLY